MSTLTLTWPQVIVLLLGVLGIYALEMAFFYWRLRQHNFAEHVARLRLQQLEEKLAILQRQLYPDPWPTMPDASDAPLDDSESLLDDANEPEPQLVSRSGKEDERPGAGEGGASYNRAIDLARTGADASVLSRDCGLSRGEADLIVALYGPKTR